MQQRTSKWRNKPATLGVLAALAASCGDGASQSARPLIQDSAHGSQRPGFYFLPPIAPLVSYSGTFEHRLSPEVRIDQLDALGQTVATIATFTARAALPSERVRRNISREHYVVRWYTDQFTLSTDTTYRIRVLTGGQELGFADVDLLASRREVRNVDTNEYVPLVDGRTLAIRFRIERSAVDADGDGVFDWEDNCPTVANGPGPEPLPTEPAPIAGAGCNPDGEPCDPAETDIPIVPASSQLDTDADGIGDACECLGVVCSGGDACNEPGACEPATGACTTVPRPDGTSCEHDSNLCTVDVCVSGQCVSTPLECTESQCGGVVCDPSRGICIPKADGTTCDDGDTATSNDICAGGSCAGAPNSPLNALVAGFFHNVAVTADGAAWTFGGTLAAVERGGPGPVGAPQRLGLSDAITVSAGLDHSLVLLSSGTLLRVPAPGAPGAPAVVPTPVNGALQIAAGGDHDLLLTFDRTVLAWGANASGQLGDGTRQPRAAPALVPGLSDIAAVVAGNGLSLALTSDGRVFGWGANRAGALGIAATTSSISSPVELTGLPPITRLASFANHTLAITDTGEVWSWGSNRHGELGRGDVGELAGPGPIPGLTGIIDVAAGLNHSLALRGDGTVWAWGSNDFGAVAGASLGGYSSQPQQVFLSAPIRSIGAGAVHSIAVTRDGRVFTWGSDLVGQLGNGTVTEESRPRAELVIGFGRGNLNVLTQNNDTHRTGANLRETVMNTSSVNTRNFGKLFEIPVVGDIYSQILYVQGGILGRDAIFVATADNYVYAFDANDGTQFWSRQLGVPLPTQGNFWCLDIRGRLGIISTPVIDLGRGVMYLTAKTNNPGEGSIWRLHALDLATGENRPNSPQVITASVAGSSSDAVNGVITFAPHTQNQRPGLLLQDGQVYIGFGSHCDTYPYHGWIMSYDARTLERSAAYSMTRFDGPVAPRTDCAVPNVRGAGCCNGAPCFGYGGGIWQGGRGIASTGTGDIYFISANTVDAGPLPDDLSNAFVRMMRGPEGELAVRDWFAPSNVAQLDDWGWGPGGPLLVPGTNLITSGGKEGRLVMLDRDNLGGFSPTDSGVLSQVSLTDTATNPYFSHLRLAPTFVGPVYWDGPAGPHIYVWPENFANPDGMRLFSFPIQGDQFGPVIDAVTSSEWQAPRGLLGISANGSSAGTGILWANVPRCGGTLVAYDASNITGAPFWTSHQHPGDVQGGLGAWAKFGFPTAIAGKVFIPTFENKVVVYGMLPEPRTGDLPPAPECVTCASHDVRPQPENWQYLYDTYFGPGAPANPVNTRPTWPAGGCKGTNGGCHFDFGTTAQSMFEGWRTRRLFDEQSPRNSPVADPQRSRITWINPAAAMPQGAERACRPAVVGALAGFLAAWERNGTPPMQ